MDYGPIQLLQTGKVGRPKRGYAAGEASRTWGRGKLAPLKERGISIRVTRRRERSRCKCISAGKLCFQKGRATEPSSIANFISNFMRVRDGANMPDVAPESTAGAFGTHSAALLCARRNRLREALPRAAVARITRVSAGSSRRRLDGSSHP